MKHAISVPVRPSPALQCTASAPARVSSVCVSVHVCQYMYVYASVSVCVCAVLHEQKHTDATLRSISTPSCHSDQLPHHPLNAPFVRSQRSRNCATMYSGGMLPSTKKSSWCEKPAETNRMRSYTCA
jgi:hypothetical protein